MLLSRINTLVRAKVDFTQLKVQPPKSGARNRDLAHNLIFIVPAAASGYGRTVSTANLEFLFCHENRH